MQSKKIGSGEIYFHYSLELALVWDAVAVDIRRVSVGDVLVVWGGVSVTVSDKAGTENIAVIV